MAESVFHVPTAFCRHCQYSIVQAVSNLRGVTQVGVDLLRQTVNVQYDPALLDDHAIHERIEGAGFPVVPPKA